jgi:hypothetical protein
MIVGPNRPEVADVALKFPVGSGGPAACNKCTQVIVRPPRYQPSAEPEKIIFRLRQEVDRKRLLLVRENTERDVIEALKPRLEEPIRLFVLVKVAIMALVMKLLDASEHIEIVINVADRDQLEAGIAVAIGLAMAGTRLLRFW